MLTDTSGKRVVDTYTHSNMDGNDWSDAFLTQSSARSEVESDVHSPQGLFCEAPIRHGNREERKQREHSRLYDFNRINDRTRSKRRSRNDRSAVAEY